MRRVPLDPPWLIVPFIALFLGAAAADSILLFYGLGFLAVFCGTIGLDRWYERYHARRRQHQR